MSWEDRYSSLHFSSSLDRDILTTPITEISVRRERWQEKGGKGNKNRKEE